MGSHGRVHVSCFLRRRHLLIDQCRSGVGSSQEIRKICQSGAITYSFQPLALDDFGQERGLVRLYPQSWQQNKCLQ